MNSIAMTNQRSNLKTAIAVLALVLVAILGYRQFARATAVPVWTAMTALGAGTRLGPDTLTQTRMRKKAIPPGVLTDRRAIEGKTLSKAKAPGHPFFAHDFAVAQRPPAAPLTASIPAGRVLTTLSIDPAAIPYPQLRYGDRLDIVAVQGLAQGNGQVVAHDAFMVGSLAPSPTKPPDPRKSALGMDLTPPKREAKGAGAKGFALILALHPLDVVPLAEAEGGNATLKLVLHGQSEVASGTLLTLEPPAPGVVELIAGADREQVTLLP